MKTFIERIQAEIIGDSTIDVYYSGLVVPFLARESLTRHDINAMFKEHIFILFNPRQEKIEGAGGNGLDDILFTVSLMAAVRTSKAYDRTLAREISLVGDSTPTRPGIFEMQDDIENLLDPGLPKNLLDDANGNAYLWDIELGEVIPDVSGPEKSEITIANREIVGHKWRKNWS